MKSHIIGRSSFAENMLKSLENKEVTFIIGPRQTGKTTFLQHFSNGLDNAAYILMEPYWKESFASGRDLISFLRSKKHIHHNTKYLFLDEVQSIDNIALVLKNIFDEYDYKVVAAGSGSLKIFRGISESMAGRYEERFLYPFSWAEYLVAYDVEVKDCKDITPTVYRQMQSYFEPILRFGSYPKVSLAKDESSKVRHLQSIYNAYIDTDIVSLFSKDMFPSFQRVYRKIASSVCSLVKIESISQQADVSYRNVKKIIEALKATFLVHLIAPLCLDPHKEVSRHHKVYFVDNGILHSAFGDYSLSDHTKGMYIENWVTSEIFKHKSHIHSVFFWQKKNQTEVDFIIKNTLDGSLMPIEVKAKHMNHIPKSLYAFYSVYRQSIKQMFVLHDGVCRRELLDGVEVIFLPWFCVGEVFE